MGEAKIFLIPCETNILRPFIHIEVTDSSNSDNHSLNIVVFWRGQGLFPNAERLFRCGE